MRAKRAARLILLDPIIILTQVIILFTASWTIPSSTSKYSPRIKYYATRYLWYYRLCIICTDYVACNAGICLKGQSKITKNISRCIQCFGLHYRHTTHILTCRILGCDTDSLVRGYQRFGEIYCLHPQDSSDYMALPHRRT